MKDRYIDFIKKRYSGSYIKRYREADEASLLRPEILEIGGLITTTCENLSVSLRVLDIGCGTGRYFHFLRNTEELWALDVSPYALEQAKNPVRAEVVQQNIRKIKFLCGNFLNIDLPKSYFNMVYSIGVLGEYIPWTKELVKFVRETMVAGGHFLFTTVKPEALESKSKRRQIAEFLCKYVPPVQTLLKEKLSIGQYSASRKQIEFALDGHFEIEWLGDCLTSSFPHHLCIARALPQRFIF